MDKPSSFDERRLFDCFRSACCRSSFVIVGLSVALLSPAVAQTTRSSDTPDSRVQNSAPSQSTAPITITLQDALERARKNDAQFLAAIGDTKIAHEDRLQARNAMLP